MERLHYSPEEEGKDVVITWSRWRRGPTHIE
jgi:hypothetical protein